MKSSKIFALIFSIIIIVSIVYGIGLNKLIEVLKHFNLDYLPIIFLLLIFDYVLAGLNTWVLANSFKKTSLKYMIKASFITLVYAVITPGKISDFLMIPFLRNQKLTLNQSTITVGFDKIISLFVKIFFGLIGTIFFLKRFNLLFLGVPLAALGLLILIVLLIRSKKFLNFIKTKILRKYSFLFKGFSKDLKKYIKNNKKAIYTNVMITIMKSVLEAFIFFTLFLSFNQPTNIVIIFFMFSLLSVIMLLTFPIGVSGVGVREFVGIVVFGAVGVGSAVVFSSFILRIFLIYLINLITVFLFKEDLNFLKNSKFFKRLKLKKIVTH